VDARAHVVPRRQPRGARPACEREQLGEAEAPVAADAGVRRLAARVGLDERVDDGAAELRSQVERHVRQPERMAGLARREHRFGGAAGSLCVGSFGVEPEPKRDADGRRAGLQQRDGAVDSAAHGHRDAVGIQLGGEDGAERVRERVGGERLAGDGRRLEQRQSAEVPLEAGRVGVDDAVAAQPQPDERELAVPRGVPDDLDHPVRLAAKELPGPRRASRPVRTWQTRWVPCRRSGSPRPDPGSLSADVGSTLSREAAHGVGLAHSSRWRAAARRTAIRSGRCRSARSPRPGLE
jgi:hypothetical protein